MTDDNGGPAFPVLPPCDMEGANASGYPFPDAGMTLRDYFAAKAMQGLLAQAEGVAFIGPKEQYAAFAYAMADSMLKERA